MGDESVPVLTQFQNILNKLRKKRILKKPNVNEAFEHFDNLGATCVGEEIPHVAGVCYQNAAKCQSSLGNTLNEAYLLRKAGRRFMDAEMQYRTHNIVSTEEWLNSSIYNYMEAADRFENNRGVNTTNMKPLSAGILLEVANKLDQNLDKTDLAALFYQKAANIYDTFNVDKVQTLQNLGSCKIKSGEYDKALTVYNRIIESIDTVDSCGFKDDVIKDAEICRLLLLLILQPTPQQLTATTAGVLERYAWVETTPQSSELVDLKSTLISNNVSMFDEDTFICLQSLVMSCQSHDTDSILLLKDDLSKHFNCQQNYLLRVLIARMMDKT